MILICGTGFLKHGFPQQQLMTTFANNSKVSRSQEQYKQASICWHNCHLEEVAKKGSQHQYLAMKVSRHQFVGIIVTWKKWPKKVLSISI